MCEAQAAGQLRSTHHRRFHSDPIQIWNLRQRALKMKMFYIIHRRCSRMTTLNVSGNLLVTTNHVQFTLQFFFIGGVRECKMFYIIHRKCPRMTTLNASGNLLVTTNHVQFTLHFFNFYRRCRRMQTFLHHTQEMLTNDHRKCFWQFISYYKPCTVYLAVFLLAVSANTQ